MSMLVSSLRRIMKRIFPGVSWRNPVVNTVYKIIDWFDIVVRMLNGRSHLPRYSIRVRSNGAFNQFGGARFQNHGRLVRQLLMNNVGLTPVSDVLEIGCGCGRNAIALAEYLTSGKYTGIDIEKVSLESCKKTDFLNLDGFVFDAIDVYNAEYNPSGKYSATEYRLQFDDGRFDVIFLISVFTHMLPDDINHYVREIARVLKRGGACMTSVFLMDRGRKGNGIAFPFNVGDYYFYDHKMPEVAVGYMLDYFRLSAKECGLTMNDPLWGTWRDKEGSREGVFPQDIIIFRKN
jgi:SAM-dependent methyltransferase